MGSQGKPQVQLVNEKAPAAGRFGLHKGEEGGEADGHDNSHDADSPFGSLALVLERLLQLLGHLAPSLPIRIPLATWASPLASLAVVAGRKPCQPDITAQQQAHKVRNLPKC